MHDFKEIQDRIELVKEEMFKRFPDCRYTIDILLWDDGTSSVKCKHGSNNDDIIYIAEHYDGELMFEEQEMMSSSIKISADGKEYYAIEKE